MFQPAYYLGRRVHVMHASSHPCTYVYTWVRLPAVSSTGVISRKPRLRLVRADAFWRSA